jgi:hypothetical protein
MGTVMSTPIDYNAVSACAAVVAALTAIVAIIAEGRRSRFSVGLDAILKLDGMWSDKRMRQARKRAAQALLQDPNSDQFDDADEVLDFFESLGLLVRRETIDKYLAWHYFYRWIHGYTTLASQYIEEIRKDDFSIWADLVFLHQEVLKVERHQRRCSDEDLKLSQEEKKEFCELEIDQETP